MNRVLMLVFGLAALLSLFSVFWLRYTDQEWGYMAFLAVWNWIGFWGCTLDD